jgi:ABC-2 type transport system ATP-binding protein
MLMQERTRVEQQPATITMVASEVVVEARELYKAYGPKVAVNGVSFTVQRGEIFGILGPNGAGKSTTLEMLEGLRDPDRGTAHIAGLEVKRNKRAVHARIGVQLQSTALFDQLSIADNLRLLGALYDRSTPVPELLAGVELADRAHSLLGTLSGGQQQRVALAAALVNDPEVVFLDEPTTGLDPQARRALWALVQSLRDRGKTIVLTTHYMEEAEVLCDRVAIMEAGRIVAIDTPAQLVIQHGGGLAIRCRFTAPVSRADLAALPGITAATGPDGTDHRYTFHTNELDRALFALLNFAERANAPVADLQVHQPGLEDVFLNLTGRALRD